MQVLFNDARKGAVDASLICCAQHNLTESAQVLLDNGACIEAVRISKNINRKVHMEVSSWNRHDVPLVPFSINPSLRFQFCAPHETSKNPHASHKQNLLWSQTHPPLLTPYHMPLLAALAAMTTTPSCFASRIYQPVPCLDRSFDPQNLIVQVHGRRFKCRVHWLNFNLHGTCNAGLQETGNGNGKR